ncbi:MAG TPA: hypothetical protein VG122_00450 [Gemmata sp.]|jgi:hypothetical protein|nr:hypothetical protein [Gemmata sp.]
MKWEFTIPSRFLLALGCLLSLHPYRWFLVSAWLFVLAVAVFDVRWALSYRDTIGLWESNPIMLCVMKAYGVWIAGAARLGTVVFAASLMPLTTRRSQITATLTLVSVHAYLALTYALIIWGPDTDIE